MADRRRHRSSATPLSMAYTALLLYASLYPFADWRWPPGQSLAALMVLPWPPWSDGFDLWSNLLGYLPLGALLCIAARRSRVALGPALLLAVGGPALLSYGTEVLQQFLPGRHPSLKDLVMNSAGALIGALLALAWHGLGLVESWHAWRQRWFLRDSAGALALMALWPVGLLFPAPVPLGLGQVGEHLREWALSAVQDVPWAEAATQLLNAQSQPSQPLQPLAEALITALGLAAPCVVASSAMVPGWRRVVMAAGATLLACASMTLSTLLNFGPTHAIAWIGPWTLPSLGLGLLLSVVVAPLGRRMVAGLGLVVLTALVLGVAQAPSDPYFAQSLQAWEQGRFVRFFGLAQWFGWLWPYAAMAWLLSRLSSRY
jgi:VanZ family protein